MQLITSSALQLMAGGWGSLLISSCGIFQANSWPRAMQFKLLLCHRWEFVLLLLLLVCRSCVCSGTRQSINPPQH
jgi:hypothetical protein